MVTRLGLGTVQFGQSYGIANSAGQVRYEEAESILALARAAGIETIDTAIAYGDSERRLGEIGVGQCKVISKLPPVPAAHEDLGAWLRKAVGDSLERLGIAKLHGLLLHRSQELLTSYAEELYGELAAVKGRGAVDKIGVSVYGPDELDALGSRFDFDIVQAPYNILDRRLVDSGWLERLRRTGTEIHVRSVFLQGLLLLKKNERPATFQRWQRLWDRWDRWLAAERLSPLAACLTFALSQPAIDRVIVGVESSAQLREILAAVEANGAVPPDDLKSEDFDLLNPFRWSAL